MMKLLLGWAFAHVNSKTAKKTNTERQRINITPQPIRTGLQRDADGSIVVRSRTDVKEHPDYPRKHLGYLTKIEIATIERHRKESNLSPFAALLRLSRRERQIHLQAIQHAISEIEEWGFSDYE
ncbi:hypothetical protein QU24_25585 [Pantoea rodasii]|uniref:Uncharacterized protein n=1 Tax=Pantoea rodasii TaxID=1076549 RepID=A0A0B1R0N8_9GAMM|nr:hypothetical protein [Pantoea rodasii]KHJ65236.1 hypothetical protein QU24_25585 [Pantoea rodasii]